MLTSLVHAPDQMRKHPFFISPKQDPLRLAARQLESGFLAEMLKSAGMGETSTGFGGGIGEAQFASFLLERQAARMVEAGGIGLAEGLFHALKERGND
jgi:Rod binding domain-containing protein